MTIQPHATDNGQGETPTIPDVSALSPYKAALAYARSGLFVLPVKTGKHPGSIVGKRWPELSTNDPDVIESYWDRPEQRGIAIHTGKSKLVAFDLDIDIVPSELCWLKQGRFQHTRRHGERGHYVFVSDDVFASTSLKLADGTKVGDIKSGNSVIIAEPSPHPKAHDDGQYRWASDGDVPKLPDTARQYLRVLGTTKAGVWSSGFEATDELVAEALKDWTDNARPKNINGQVNKIRQMRAATRDTARDALRILAQEARAGLFPLATAVEKVRAAMLESYEKRGEDKFSDEEFDRLVKNGVGYALSRSLHEIMDEVDRNYNGFDVHKPIFRSRFTSAFKSQFGGLR